MPREHSCGHGEVGSSSGNGGLQRLADDRPAGSLPALPPPAVTATGASQRPPTDPKSRGFAVEPRDRLERQCARPGADMNRVEH